MLFLVFPRNIVSMLTVYPTCNVSAAIIWSLFWLAVDPICSDDLLLYFPYDVDFDDVTCHHAKGYAYGDGVASIVNDPDRGRVVCFDGNVRIEVRSDYLIRQ